MHPERALRTAQLVNRLTGVVTNFISFHDDTLCEPDSKIRELLLGFVPGDISTPELSEAQRHHLLGQCIDINLLSWFINCVAPTNAPPRTEVSQEQPTLPPQPVPILPLSVMAPGAFTSDRQYAGSQPLPPPPRRRCPTHLLGRPTSTPPPPLPPRLIPWTPHYDPEVRIYTDGSLIEGEGRLGAAVIHKPSATSLHIDASGLAETHTIMRAELVAIHVALGRLISYLDQLRSTSITPGTQLQDHLRSGAVALRGRAPRCLLDAWRPLRKS